jgi:hypothetical protein
VKISPLAWRVAAKNWLVKNELIKIHKAGKVLPDFLENCAIISDVARYVKRNKPAAYNSISSCG